MTGHIKTSRRELISELKMYQRLTNKLAYDDSSKILVRENIQLTRDLIRERQRTAGLRAQLRHEQMTDADSPIPYTLAESVHYEN